MITTTMESPRGISFCAISRLERKSKETYSLECIADGEELLGYFSIALTVHVVDINYGKNH